MTRYQIESRESEGAAWTPWPFVVALSSRADAEAQAQLLASREPYPIRSGQSRREFRVAEVEIIAGCPRCLLRAEGPLCQYHVAMGNLGSQGVAPRPMPAPAGRMMPSPKVRRSPRSGYGPEAIETLRRQHQQRAEAIGTRVPKETE